MKTQKFITKEIDKAFQKQGDCSEKSWSEIFILVKFFNPYGGGTWYVYDRDPDNPDRLWCFANLGDPMMAEIGTVWLSELESIRIPPFGLPLERDTGLQPFKYTLEEVYHKIKNGGHI